MRMETTIALQNMKYHKNKNILIGIAICLTSFLLFLVPSMGFNMLNAQSAVVNKLYPTWHAIFRNVDGDTVNRLSAHHDVGTHGVRSDIGCIDVDGADITMMYLDKSAYELYRMSPEEGTIPAKENEILLSKGILEELGVQADIGDTITIPYQVYRDGGLDYTEEKDMVICGFVADSEASREKRIYTAFVSGDFMTEVMPAGQSVYQFLFQVNTGTRASTDTIENTIKQLAEQFGLSDKEFGINDEYLMANYVDPTIVPVIVIIMLIIVLAGVITIYSIYYVNMPERVQEFGRLKSIGATRRQMRQIVLREGLFVTMIALPIGLIIGTILTKVIFVGILKLYQEENVMMNTMMEMSENNEIALYHGWLYLLAVVITIFTTMLSLQKPMKIASRISEIDAMHFAGERQSKRAKKKSRKSFDTINVFRLSRIYLADNKKNSIITIVSMSITGIFVMVIATVLSCANPTESANDSILGQYVISVATEHGNKEHPEREWAQVIKDNPMKEELLEQILAVDGVKSVAAFDTAYVTVTNPMEEREGIHGVPEEYADELLDGIIEGSATYEELTNGDNVIVDKNLLRWYPQITLGSTIEYRLEDGSNSDTRKLKVIAIGDYSTAFSDYSYLMMASDGVERLAGKNVTNSYHILADKTYDENTEKELKNIIADNDILQMETWQQRYIEWKGAMSLTSGASYAFLGIISAICIMNMVNTMINSVHIRKKEIGMMQAIGMADKQLVRMLQQEGMFYTLGTLLISVGVGSALGYPVFLWAKDAGMFNISTYHYPWMIALIVSLVLIVIQAVLAVTLGRSVKKQSQIERIRFSE